MEDKINYINEAFALAKSKGICHSKRELAALLGVNEATLSRAFGGDEKYLTDSLIKKIRTLLDAEEKRPSMPSPSTEAMTVPLLPWEAKGGRIGDFVDGTQLYHCEQLVSPIKGADFAMQVTGDSMSPEFPSGSVILIQRVNESIFIEWGKVYVLDTPNGAIIKKIKKTAEPNVIECISINPEYQTFRLNCDHINGWYRVLMVMAAK